MSDMAREGRVEVQGFDDLFAAHFAPVTRAVYFVLRDWFRAEEITQEAFVKLLKHWRKVSRYERPELWVRRVAMRDAIHDRRRERRRSELHALAGQAVETAPDPGSLGTTHSDLMTHLQRLAPQQRAVVVLFYLEDRPMDEIAEIVGCAPSTAWNHLRSARARLATLMGEEVPEDVR
jgi:RNA polymerase sigma factor (sigma-70 family)